MIGIGDYRIVLAEGKCHLELRTDTVGTAYEHWIAHARRQATQAGETTDAVKHLWGANGAGERFDAVDEAIAAVTVGGAAALRRSDIGRLTPGSAGHAVILDAPSHHHLAYRPGVPLIRRTIGPLAHAAHAGRNDDPE